ncbi:hypothetical protein [Qipengyuania citrea]|uniref:hypothetical protein n=1 Tax=Qipengyuania citrea TaxID=225971 RepID=UPI003299152A
MTTQKRIAKPLDQAQSHYTVLVVGSGYGAGVAASRLARAGQQVAVLERGRERLPGEYPNKLADAQGAMQINAKGGRIGEPDALFELHVNDDQYALVGCGLGGTSLINANVALELDKRLLDQAHWPAARHFRTGAIDEGKAAIRQLVIDHPNAMSPGLSFTETMAGHISATGCHHRPCGHVERIRDDYANGEAWGRSEGSACDFRLTVTTDNLHRMLEEKDHRSRITGAVTVSALSPDPLPVREGTFRLLVADPERAESWTMLYDMVLEGPEGPVHFHGFKTLAQRGKSDPWTDLTTLFVTLRTGEDATGELIGRGVLKLGVDEFMRQLTTIEVHDSNSLIGHVVNLIPQARKAIETYFVAKYAGFFAMTTFRAYGGMLATLNDFPAKDAAGLVARALRLPPPERHVVPTADGINIGLTRYRGGPRGPLVLAPGLSVRASSFATPTVEENLAESLVAQGYDVWLFDYRASADSGNDTEHPPEFTIDDIARHDWPAAIRKIRAVTGADSVQAIAHCVGSMSLLMGIGAGWVSGVRSMIASQLTLHPVSNSRARHSAAYPASRCW